MRLEKQVFLELLVKLCVRMSPSCKAAGQLPWELRHVNNSHLNLPHPGMLKRQKTVAEGMHVLQLQDVGGPYHLHRMVYEQGCVGQG